MKTSQLTGWILLLCATGFLLVGCDTLTSNESKPKVQLRTNQNLYSASSIIELTASNYSNASVYYQCAGVVALQELSDGDVQKRWTINGFEFCGWRSLEVNQAIKFAFDLSSEFLKERLADAQFDKSVEYRFVFGVYEQKDDEHPLSERSQRSNRFFIIQE